MKFLVSGRAGHIGAPLALGLLVLLAASPVFAQRVTHTLIGELGGGGGIVTLSYEAAVGRVAARAGVGLTPEAVLVPLTATYRIKNDRSKVELGGGVALPAAVADESETGPYVLGMIAYSYQVRHGPLVFRAAFNPLVGNGDVIPWVGLGAGARF